MSRIEWYKPARKRFIIDFHDEPDLVENSTTLEEGSTPSVSVHQLTDENPETWTDVTADVTIEDEGVEEAFDEHGRSLGELLAVGFTLDSEPSSEDPAPGEAYSVVIIANRADDPTLQVSRRVWLVILA